MKTLFLIRKTFVNGLELHIMNIGLIQYLQTNKTLYNNNMEPVQIINEKG
jgi:hypothetical protein